MPQLLPFVYHAETRLRPGTDSLHSLADLRHLDEKAYRHAMAKYDDTEARRRLARTLIPLIDRLWTEVVFLSPIHPHALWTAWREVSGEKLPPMRFWEIPLESVPEDAVVFDRTRTATGDPISPLDVTPLARDSYRAATRTTDRNREWLHDLAASGRRGAWFNLTPHVLTAGPVALRDARVVSWDDPPSGPRA